MNTALEIYVEMFQRYLQCRMHPLVPFKYVYAGTVQEVLIMAQRTCSLFVRLRKGGPHAPYRKTVCALFL